MKRYLEVIILLLAAIGLAVWFWSSKPTSGSGPTTTPQSESAAPLTSTAVPAQPSGETKVQQPGGSYEPSDPRWKWWNEMNKKDQQFEWKVPLNFYGQVLDEQNQPVVGATIEMTWTDLSSTGSSSAEILSNASGNFSLTDQQGKRLVVNSVTKEGYYLSKTENQFSYEYAAFFERNYHEPDPNNPVIFRMRKQSEAEPLVHRQAEITVGVGRIGVVQLDPQTAVQIELIENREIRENKWSARVSVPGGGIQVSTEEFPFAAPENGYQPSLTLDSETPKPANWTQLYQGGQFYVKTVNGQYGRIELKTVSGKTFMRYSFFLNPSGSRNLEYDPSNVVRSP